MENIVSIVDAFFLNKETMLENISVLELKWMAAALC